MDEQRYNFLLRLRKKAARLPIYGAHLEVERKVEFLREAGIGEIEVWCGDVSVGEVPVEWCSQREINGLVINFINWTNYEVNEYVKARRAKGASGQGKFDFGGGVGDEPFWEKHRDARGKLDYWSK